MGSIPLSQIYSMLIHVRSLSAFLFDFHIFASKSNTNVSIHIVHLITKLKRIPHSKRTQTYHFRYAKEFTLFQNSIAHYKMLVAILNNSLEFDFSPTAKVLYHLDRCMG